MASAALMLSACGVTDKITEAGKIDYKSSVSTRKASLEVPPDLVSPRADDRFTVERPENRTASGFQRGQAADRATAGAPQSRVLPEVIGARIERSGAQRWLVVDQTPEVLWPVVRKFWEETGFVIDIDRPEAGILETDWAENRAKLPQDLIRDMLGKVLDGLYSTGERDRFRTRLERTASGTEVYITHRGLIEIPNPNTRISTVWAPRPSDPELEAEFLRRLLIRLGVERARAQAILDGQATQAVAPPPQRARIVESPEGRRIDLDESFDRAWRRVGVALDRGGFTVEDRDRSKGLYFVRYIDPEAEARGSGKPGLLSRVFGGGKPPASSRQYQVSVTAAGDASRIAIAGRDGQALTSEADREVGGKVLALLLNQLKQ